MEHHWLTFLIGVSILRGVQLSPIPVSEEEWAEFSKSLRDVAYRLPTTTKPSHYILNLTPYFEVSPENTPNDTKPFSFEGSVDITIRATTVDVKEIVMHCNDLTILSVNVEYTNNDSTKDDKTEDITVVEQNFECDEQYSFLKIQTREALKLNTDYTVKIKFTGNIQSNMRGFYRSWYFDSIGVKRWMGTTQFQPGHAREAFPCYDEPAFKAEFDITINREEDFSPTLSNMPIKKTEELPNGRIAETFYTTPKTSTYLLAFIVSHYKNIAESENEERPFKIFARDNAVGTGDWALEIGVKLLDAMENYTQIDYYEMADKIDMKQAAIPDFSAGAMENWGLLTYREALILYDKENSNHHYKQRVANIVAHEIAHMWFGNLVTCAWWDNLWLNEGFARFYQYYLTEQVASDLAYATRFINEQFLQALRADSTKSSHPLTTTSVNSPSAVSSQFSTITYAKGASVIRMTQHLLGSETFVKGLRKYLVNRKYDVAEPEHLFEALQAAAEEDNSLSKYPDMTVDRYFKSWSEQAGHPVLNVIIDQDSGQMTVTQGRWHIDNGVSEEESLWDIPITWTSAGTRDFTDLKPSQFISNKTTVIERGTQDREWVVFNKQATGFYRINYDNNNWALITQALRRDPKEIDEYNRAQIVDDVFAFGRAKLMQYNQVFNILSFLEFEDQYTPWMAAINGFNFIRTKLAHDSSSTGKLQILIKQFSKSVTERLGYKEKENEPFMDGLLRMNVMEFFCNNGHAECIEAAEENFQKWQKGEKLPANMRPWVYCTGLRSGGSEAFNHFWTKFINEQLASEQMVMIEAAGCTGNQETLEQFLNAIVENDQVIRPQDVNVALMSAVSSNNMNARRVFDWLQDNVEKVKTRFGSVSPVLNLITPRLLRKEDMEKAQSWLDDNKNTIGESAYQSAVNGIKTAQENMNWTSDRLAELLEYFENGFVDELATTVAPPVSSETPSTTGPPATTEPPSTTDPDDDGGAATITLSVVALIVSLSINLLN